MRGLNSPAKRIGHRLGIPQTQQERRVLAMNRKCLPNLLGKRPYFAGLVQESRGNPLLRRGEQKALQRLPQPNPFFNSIVLCGEKRHMRRGSQLFHIASVLHRTFQHTSHNGFGKESREIGRTEDGIAQSVTCGLGLAFVIPYPAFQFRHLYVISCPSMVRYRGLAFLIPNR